MTAFTVNSVTSKGPWVVADGYSPDVSTSTAFLAAITGNSHLVRSISIDFGKVDKYIEIYDGTDLQIGPFICGSKHWTQTFQDGLTFEEGVYIKTEADSVTHVTVEYQIVPR
jgi:hypothetical protein